MKTFTFFNGKGGVGKSLHTVLFASWLSYHEGKRVCVIDCEDPDRGVKYIREQELRDSTNPDSVIGRYLSKHPDNPVPYDVTILAVPSLNSVKGTKRYDEDFINRFGMECLKFFRFNGDKYDYVIFDFPATLIENNPAIYCIGTGYVNLSAVPMDLDAATRKSALITADLIRVNEAKCVLFWNNVPSDCIKRKGFLESGEALFVREGFEVLPQRVKSFRKAQRDSASTQLFVKSTLCWPQRYVDLNCPELNSLYAELKNRLDNC